jgi:hypothetical protein
MSCRTLPSVTATTGPPFLLAVLAAAVMGLPPLVAADAVPLEKSKSRPDSAQASVPPVEKPPTPHIIVASHVLLWDNQIVTWDEAVTRLRAIRAANGGPFHASFHFTNGVYNGKERNYNYWSARIYAHYAELFQPAGISMGSLSPRAGLRYDAIRTADDLRPQPARARSGRIVTPAGKPAAGAQVVVLPLVDMLGVAMEGIRLREPLDEEWTPSDAAGGFTVYPKTDAYWIAVLHPDGFLLRRELAKDKTTTLQLAPWAVIAFSNTSQGSGQSADFTCNPEGTGPDFPVFRHYSIQTHGKPIDFKVPPGRIVVNRSIPMGEGTSISQPAVTLTLKPGERHFLELAPAGKSEQERANQLHKLLNDARKAK